MARRPVTLVLSITVASFLLVGVSFGAGIALARGPGLIAQAQEVAEGHESEREEGRPLPIASPVGLRVRTCSVDPLTQDERLGTLSAVVLEPLSGDILFSRNADSLVTPASVAKVVTGAVALEVLGPERTFQTTVVASSEPDTVVLVAGGDPTLTTVPEGAESVYVGAPKISLLAQQVIASLLEGLPEGEKVRIDNVIIDTSIWADAPTWQESWSPSARANGFISQITALQVDGDRRDPSVDVNRRTDDASARAARAFIDALRAAGNTARFVSLSDGSAEQGARVLGSVSSRPVSDLVTYMLKESDNTLAEYLARHVAVNLEMSADFEAVGPAFSQTLAGYGLPESDIVFHDGSGLSANNRVTPLYIAALLREIHQSGGSLGMVKNGLPIAGVDGSLEDRFIEQNSPLVGKVAAKTGSISGVRSLAGFVTADDGSDLVFAVFTEGDIDDTARIAIENLVAGFSSCGENLADF